MVREGVEDIGDENEISVWIHAAPQVPGSQGQSGAVRGSQGAVLEYSLGVGG